MAKTLETIEGRLERVTAQLEQAAKRSQGGGLMSMLKPFALGALVGAGAALLYAPQAGEQTRAVLRRNADDLQDRATQAASGVTARLPDQAKEVLAQAREQTKTVMDQGKDTLQSAQSGMKQVVGPAESATNKQAANNVRADEAQAQLQRDLKTGRENPA
ncbi:MAG: hypothetical protein AVDCRST_MAG18-4835 [uncultured Thermomicrobiales bacterium]|uniref:YtxH domain-containing protein n=1 Tax=uncultured Thermomicrobiales bacterium TaxID=1645740 RepID=A0A6J4VUS0_9BACT|nr:MAG: hypothetical protein AVDCRST_MAG18-4835 [uncultured Thermomicrobiales bacterium]